MNNSDNLLILPPGWIYAQLGDLIEPSKEKINPVATDSSHYIGLEHIEKDTGKILSYGKSEEVTSTKSVFCDGDLLYGKLRPYLNKVCIPDFNGVCSTDILVFTRQAYLSNKYLKYRMLCPDFVRFANQNATGVNHPRIDFKKISTFVLALPPLAEQHRIVAKIEELFTKLDAGVESLKKAKVQLKLYRKVILQNAVTGKLTKDWRDCHTNILPPIRTNLPSIANKKKRAGRLWGSGVIPELDDIERSIIPKSWTWVKVHELGKSYDDTVQVGPMSMQSKDFIDSGVPVLNVGCVQWGYIDESKLNYLPKDIADKFDRYKILENDILFTRSGTVGRCALAKQKINGYLMTFHLLRVRVDNCKCVPEYLQYVFWGLPTIHKQTNAGAIGTTRAGFNTSLLANLDVPIPSLEEQYEIIRRIDSFLTILDSTELSITNTENRSEILKQSLLMKAFSGKLVPQNPNDEPAEMLLERIQAERTQKEGRKERAPVRKRGRQTAFVES